MALHNLHGYEFKDFSQELEDIHRNHLHEVRREQYVTYKDEFALQQLLIYNPVLYEQFVENWSRSYYVQQQHMNAILMYNLPNKSFPDINEETYTNAVLNVREQLRSLPIVRAFDVLTELDQINYESTSSAGYDYNGTKGPIGEFNHTRAIRRAKATLWSAIAPDGEGIEHVIRTSVPDVGYTRTQLTDLREKTKVRGVWGRAFHYILLEGTTAHPLLEAFKQGNTFFHIGQDPTVSVPQILSDTARECNWLYAIDWSSFDATVSRVEIHAAFDLLKERIQFPNVETYQCFELCRQLFIHKKIAAPDGKVYWSHKGIPSGSYFTSIIGSIVNRIRIEYVWLSLEGKGPKMCYTQGDDSLSGDDKFIPPERMANVANPIGWLFNPAKTETSRYPEAVTFLGRTLYGGLNQRDLKRCLRLLILPEFPVSSGAISSFRAQSIADDAGGTSDVLNTIARQLRRKYGLPPPEDVPREFRPYRY